MENIRRIVRREDTVRNNREYTTLTTAQEVITPNTYTPVLAAEITPKAQDSVVIFTAGSISVKDPTGYGKVRVRWTQGGIEHSITESEGKILPLGGEEYHRELIVTGLTVGDAVGVSLEFQPLGATLSVDNAILFIEEW